MGWGPVLVPGGHLAKDRGGAAVSDRDGLGRTVNAADAEDSALAMRTDLARVVKDSSPVIQMGHMGTGHRGSSGRVDRTMSESRSGETDVIPMRLC